MDSHVLAEVVVCEEQSQLMHFLTVWSKGQVCDAAEAPKALPQYSPLGTILHQALPNQLCVSHYAICPA